MSTRSMTELFGSNVRPQDEPKIDGLLPEGEALFYRHWDGYPDFMIPHFEGVFAKLSTMPHARGFAWGDAEKVGAFLPLLTAADDFKPWLPRQELVEEEGVSLKPQFEPATRYHGDVEYLYRVFLDHVCGGYTIRVYKWRFDADSWELIGEASPRDDLMVGDTEDMRNLMAAHSGTKS